MYVVPLVELDRYDTNTNLNVSVGVSASLFDLSEFMLSDRYKVYHNTRTHMKAIGYTYTVSSTAMKQNKIKMPLLRYGTFTYTLLRAVYGRLHCNFKRISYRFLFRQANSVMIYLFGFSS